MWSPRLLCTFSKKLKFVGKLGEGGLCFFPSSISLSNVLSHFLWNNGKQCFAIYYYTCYDLNCQIMKDIFLLYLFQSSISHLHVYIMVLMLITTTKIQTIKYKKKKFLKGREVIHFHIFCKWESVIVMTLWLWN